MRQYFQNMAPIGRELKESEKEGGKANAIEILKVEEELADVGVVEQAPQRDGRTMLMVLAPK